MARKIYNRFEILKESAGSPSNIAYKAQDLDGSIVQLLEWTPEPGALAVSKAKLNDYRDEVPDVEVFSSGASLYIASATAAGALAAVQKLQSWDLFLGPWPGMGEIPEAIPDPPLPFPTPRPPVVEELPREATPEETTLVIVPPAVIPPVPPPPKPKPTVARRSPWLTPAIAVFALILLVVVGGVSWNQRNRRIAEEQRQQQTKLAEVEREREEEQRKLAAATAQKNQEDLQARMSQAERRHQVDLANERKQKEDAEERLRREQARERRRIETAKADQERKQREERARQDREKARQRVEIAKAQQAQRQKDDLEKRQEQERSERENAKAITDGFAQRQIDLAGGLSNQYHRIRLIDKCDSVAIKVAVRFQSLDHAWVTQGWWALEPHQEKTASLVYSQNATFYFYAEGGDNVWNGQDANAVGSEVVENAFTHITGPIFGKNRRTVKMIRRDFSSGYGEHAVPFDCHN
jgi:hypothetical protein